MSHAPTIEVIRDSGRASATRGQRFLRTATFVCLVLTLGGIGIGDLLPREDPEAAARAHVITEASKLAPEIDPGWLDQSPPPVRKRAVPERIQRAWLKTPKLQYLCEINETLLRALWQPGKGLTDVLGPDAPREYDVFLAPDGSIYPRFRYPPNTTLPDGLTTNAFGFRGPDVPLNKPPNTVRLAFVGASATVDGHYFAWSFPELVGHWLQLWAEAKGLDVRFEVLNAGREAIGSADIRAIVAQEVLPLAVDYVVYYEGQNQFGLPGMLRLVQVEGDFAAAKPPAHVIADLEAADTVRPHWLDSLCSDSETARRLRRLLGIYDQLPEPRKPAQALALPEGLREDAPDLTRADELMQLGEILRDLDGIRAACTAAHARFVMCSFDRVTNPGLRTDLKTGHSLYSHLNRDYWPLSYDSIQRLDALQNRYFEAWARDRGVPFLDVAAQMPDAPELFTDMVHATEPGSRLRAWIIFAGLLPIIEADLASGAVPAPDEQQDTEHPHLKPARHLTAKDLDK